MRVIIYLLLFISCLFCVDVVSRVDINLTDGSKTTKLPYGYYDPALYRSSMTAFKDKDLSSYGDKHIFGGYGLYDKSENNCKFMEINPTGESDWKSFEINYENNITVADKTYAISLNTMSYSSCLAEANKYHGTVYTPENSVENNKVSNDNFFKYNSWIGYTRTDCSSDYQNSFGRTQEYENFLNPYEPCDSNKLGVIKPANTHRWKRENLNTNARCLIEIDSPNYKAPKKICAPWFKIQRIFKNESDNIAINGQIFDLDYLAYSQFSVPIKRGVCSLVNVAYTEEVNKDNKPRVVQCKSYYDRLVAEQCNHQMQQATCRVNECDGYIKNSCSLKMDLTPAKPYEYRYVYDENGNAVKEKIKDGIVTHVYECPPVNPPTASQCEIFESVLVYPKECNAANASGGSLKAGAKESDCEGLKACILAITDRSDDAQYQACESATYCERQYGHTEIYGTDGRLKALSAPCNNGYTVEVDGQYLSETKRQCLEYENIDEVNTTQLSCQVALTKQDYTVNTAITEDDIYQDDPMCVRINDIYEARPEISTRFDYNNNGFFKTIIKKAYLDGTDVDTNTSSSQAYLMVSSSSKMEECGMDLDQIQTGQVDDNGTNDPANVMCPKFAGNGDVWRFKRLAPFFDDSLDSDPTVPEQTEYIAGLQGWIPSDGISELGKDYTLAITNNGGCKESSKIGLGQTFKKSFEHDINDSTCTLEDPSTYILDGNPELGKYYDRRTCDVKKNKVCDSSETVCARYVSNCTSRGKVCGNATSVVTATETVCAAYSERCVESKCFLFDEAGDCLINTCYKFTRTCTATREQPIAGGLSFKTASASAVDDEEDCPTVCTSWRATCAETKEECLEGRYEPFAKTNEFRPQEYAGDSRHHMGVYDESGFPSAGMCYMMSERILGDDLVKSVKKVGSDIEIEISVPLSELECNQTSHCIDSYVESFNSATGKCILKAADTDAEEAVDPVVAPTVTPTVKTIKTASGSFATEIDGTKDIYSIQEYADATRGFGYFTNFHAKPIVNNQVQIGGVTVFPIETFGTVNKTMDYTYDSSHKTQHCKNKVPKEDPKFELDALCLNIVDTVDPHNPLFEGLVADLTQFAGTPLGATALLFSILYGGAATMSYFGYGSFGSFLPYFQNLLATLGSTLLMVAFIVAVVVILIIFFAKPKKYGNFSHDWEIKEDIPARLISNKYDSRLIDKAAGVVWYDRFKYTTGLLKQKDYNQRVSNYLESKKKRLEAHGYSSGAVSSTLNRLEKSSIGYPAKGKWYKFTWRKTKTDEVNGTSTLNKPLNTAYVDAVNSVSIVVPYQGDFEVKAYDKYNNLLASKIVLQSDFIKLGSGQAYSSVVQFGTSPISTEDGDGKFTIASGVGSASLNSGACLASKVLEWGGGVSGAYYEVNTPEGYTCSKSNDAWVESHSATKLVVRPTNFSRGFVVDLEKPLPYANRVYLINLGAKENRDYECYVDDNCTITAP
ncbi:MAG: Unknown protein [uncultured Campylobacterales bacterium]|uniref:Uncharacterized protein n=1 Tax=uncultured Campylobacterales bacterium TaxID=352960 RepID=A0A6S6T7Y2_9BACT|nr:MAG: Unknown protein [uncultured Campylobacterales bacterium]